MSSRSLSLVAMLLIACSPSDGTGPSPPPIPPPPPPPVVPPPPPPPPAPTVTLTVLPNMVEKGSNAVVSVSWNTQDAETCTSSWAETVPCSGSYTFTPTEEEDLWVKAYGPGGSKTASASIQVADPPTLSLSLFAPEGQGSIEGLQASFLSGAWDSTLAVVSSSVSVSLPKSVRDRMGSDIRITIDAANGSMRKFLPAVGSVSRSVALTGQGLPVVLIPAKWNIPCGTFAGHVEDISLVKAHALAGDGNLFYKLITANNVLGWFWEHFPRFWTFDRAESNVEFTSADSLAQEATWSRLNAAFCETFAKYGTYEETLAEGGWFLRVKTDHPVLGNAGYSVKDLQTPYLYWGVTTLRSKDMLGGFGQEHEIVHTLGFGHTCSWFTVMYTGCSSSQNSQAITASDVAYIKLYYAIRKLEVAKSATFGMKEALAGEQEIILGLPPSATLSASSVASASGLGTEMARDAVRVASTENPAWVWFHHDEHDH